MRPKPPSKQRRACRKYKIESRMTSSEKLALEITRTREKLEILLEIRDGR